MVLYCCTDSIVEMSKFSFNIVAGRDRGLTFQKKNLRFIFPQPHQTYSV